jgi:transcriptional regulator with XRE-family HTH domain
MNASNILRRARRRAGLTQTQVASRLGISQAAIAQIEAPGSNPTVETLERVLSATGHRLELRVARRRVNLDEAQLRARLKLTPRERLEAFMASQRNLTTLRGRARRA